MPLKTIFISIKWKPGDVWFMKGSKRIFDTDRTTQDEVASGAVNSIVNRSADLLGKSGPQLRSELEVKISDKKEE